MTLFVVLVVVVLHLYMCWIKYLALLNSIVGLRLSHIVVIYDWRLIDELHLLVNEIRTGSHLIRLLIWVKPLLWIKLLVENQLLLSTFSSPFLHRLWHLVILWFFRGLMHLYIFTLHLVLFFLVIYRKVIVMSL